jgi:hypothetical protein
LTDNKSMNGQLTNHRVYRAITPAWLPEDLEELERFFQKNRRLKKGDFYRDAIIREIRRFQKRKASEGVEEAV